MIQTQMSITVRLRLIHLECKERSPDIPCNSKRPCIITASLEVSFSFINQKLIPASSFKSVRMWVNYCLQSPLKMWSTLQMLFIINYQSGRPSHDPLSGGPQPSLRGPRDTACFLISWSVYNEKDRNQDLSQFLMAGIWVYINWLIKTKKTIGFSLGYVC